MTAGLTLTACATVNSPPARLARPDGVNGTMRPYEVNGVWYTPRYQPGYDEVGLATWYGYESPNRQTADGEPFDIDALSAAHKTLPLPCLVEVTSLETGRRIQVRVNDRGPFVEGRIIDLSPRAARELGITGKGSARVRVRYLGPPAGIAAAAVMATAQPTPRPVPRAVTAPAALPAYRIRAAAFADRANADRAVATLSAQGVAHIETVDRDGVTLYRVEVDCPSDTTPETFLRRVIDVGFPGAKVVAAS